MTTSKARWTSKTVRAGIVVGIAGVVGFVGTITGNPDLVISAEFQTEIISAIMNGVTTISAVMVIIGRIKAKHVIK